MTELIWFSTTTASQRTGHHPKTILKAAEAGDLHGTQRKAKGRWRFHRDCLDAWINGEQCAHGKGRSAT